MGSSHSMSLDEAISGLARWGADTFGQDPHFSVFDWQPSAQNIDAAANAGYTWPRFQLERATGDRGLGGIYEYMNAHGWHIPPAVVAQHTTVHVVASPGMAEAADGLAIWGTNAFGGDPHFSALGWVPTKANIEAAHAAGLTWSYADWEAASGGQGLPGIHAALNEHGFQISRAAADEFGR